MQRIQGLGTSISFVALHCVIIFILSLTTPFKVTSYSVFRDLTYSRKLLRED